MSSEKVSRILATKTELTTEQIAALSDADAWGIVYSLRTIKTERLKKENQVCFTGFSPANKSRLQQIATDAGLEVVKSVTRDLSYLITGPSAGPAKCKLALEQEAILMTEEQFASFLNDGVIPLDTSEVQQ